MILVVGATGLVGSGICQNLSAKCLPYKALVRETSDPGKVANLKALGAQLVTGDLRDPASLKTACQGVDAVIETVSAMPFATHRDPMTALEEVRPAICARPVETRKPMATIWKFTRPFRAMPSQKASSFDGETRSTTWRCSHGMS